ncbi:hypothetical protein SAMN05428987_4992 [Paenibacillus sp. CF095]|nr:hypothetical protein SAMN05428987_4992 [Paenibacillus sp. CF095]
MECVDRNSSWLMPSIELRYRTLYGVQGLKLYIDSISSKIFDALHM